jgi:hypothetical protein
MFASLRRHQSWILLIIVVVVSISMVVFFTSDVSLQRGPGASEIDLGSINGRPVTVDEYRDASQEVRLAYVLQTGKPAGSDEQTQRAIEQQTLGRLLLIQKMKELDIKPSTKAIGRVTQERIGDYPYDKLMRELIEPAGLTAQDFERFMRHEAGIQQLVAAAGISAKLIHPREAEILYRRDNRESKVDLAVFWASNYLDHVVITNGAVSNFFALRSRTYSVPEQVQLSYVEFPASNYLAEANKELNQITNLTALLDEVYLRSGGTNFFKDTNGVPLAEADAKQKIKDEELHRRALVGARRAATEFGRALLSQPQPHTGQTFEALAQTNGYAIKVSSPFDRIAGLEGTDLPAEFRLKGLALTEQALIAYTPIAGTNAVYVVALKRRIPSSMPTFDQVKDKVTNDYKYSQARELAFRAGTAFHTNLTNGLKLNKSFDELAAAHQVKVISLPPFSASSDPLTNIDTRINFNIVQRFAQDLNPGEASPSFLPSADGGMIVYLRERLPLDEEKVKKELPDFMTTLRRYRQDETFRRWLNKEAELARLAAPRREMEETQSGPPPGSVPR